MVPPAVMSRWLIAQFAANGETIRLAAAAKTLKFHQNLLRFFMGWVTLVPGDGQVS